MIDDILKDAEERMQKSVENTKHELAMIRTGRASPALLDVVKVDCYGSVVNLKQIANVGIPDSRLLVVQPYDKNTIAAIVKAINQSNMGLTPQSDGNIIRLPIPQLTEERRKELVKYVHKLVEEGRIAIRNVRRDANEMIKDLEKSHDISEDESYKTLEKVQDLTDDHIKKIDELLHSKEKEIMEG